MDLKWRHAGFSATWRRRSKVNADSERQSPTSYLRLIITFGLYSISDRFQVISICLCAGNEVIPVSSLGGVVSERSMRIMKGSPLVPSCD